MLTFTALAALALFCTYCELYNQDLVEEVGTRIIVGLQGQGSYWLDLVFEVLGEVTGAMFLVASGGLYLCGFEEIGFLGSCSGFFGAALSGTAKMLILHPRPFLKVGEIRNFTCPADWGAPSGHAFSAGAGMFVLGYFWLEQRSNTLGKALFLTACSVIIAVDRVYLGVHYPFQVVLGYSYAALIGLYFTRSSLRSQYRSLRTSNSLILSEHLKISVYVLYNIYLYNTQSVQIPLEWKTNYLEKCGKDFTLEGSLTKNLTESFYTIIIAGFLLGYYLNGPGEKAHKSYQGFFVGSAVCVGLIVYILLIDKLCLKFLPTSLKFLILGANRYFSGFLIGYVGPKLVNRILNSLSRIKKE